jgi:Mrp family chromosome partitioning ATPase/capsular polysaccharide biosynthesis protein
MAATRSDTHEGNPVELSHFARAIARFWFVALVVFVLCLGASAYLAYEPADRYQATATMLVEPSDVSTVGDVAAVNFLIPALQVQLTTGATTQRAAGIVDPAVRRHGVGVSSSVDPGTGVLRVTTSGVDRAAVAVWANAYARALVEEQPSGSPLSIRVIDPATTPSSPSGPARTSTIVSGGVLGFILALGAALVAYALRNRRHLPGEIKDRFGVPVLAEIPRIRRGSRAATAAELLSGDDDELIEPIMRARASIESRVAQHDLRSIAVTSQEPAEGKTLVVGALAMALTAAGRHVSVVEADLRRPALREHVAQQPESPDVGSGLELGVGEDGEAQRVTFLSAADLVTLARSDLGRRHGASHPADVITVALPNALRLLERPDTVVLVDTPSLRYAAEASVAVRLTSAVVVVVDASRRRALETLEQALARVDEVGAVAVGVVLTRTRRPRTRGRAGKSRGSRSLPAALGRSGQRWPQQARDTAPLG